MKISLAALTGIATLGATQNIATFCAPENNGICFSVHIPSGNASSGSGDIYMQISGPSSFSWLGLGQAPEGMMAGSNMFVVYPSQNGSSVTVSPRLGMGHFEPKPDQTANITVLEGSGVSDGKMVANIRCSNCNSWPSGSMALDDAKSTWIYAYGPDTTLRNNSVAAYIPYHPGYGAFTANLQDATGSDDDTESSLSSYNPFANRAIPTSGTASSTKKLFYSDAAIQATEQRARLAHGILGALAFGLFFPLGGVLMRLGAAGRNSWKVHGVIQMFAYLMAFTVLGLGVWLAGKTRLLDSTHAILGLVTISGVGIMPVLGWMQHAGFVKKGKRTAWGYTHAYLGRILTLLGVVTFPLGLNFGKKYQPTIVRNGNIAYGVLVGIIGISWLAVIMFTAVQRRRKSSSTNTSAANSMKEKETVYGVKGSGASSSESGVVTTDSESETARRV